MKYEEYEAIAKGLTTENAPDIVNQLLENIKVDTTAFESMAQANADMDKKIRDLQDTNIRLFLSSGTGKADDDTPDEEQLRAERKEHFNQEIEKMLKGE